MIADSSVARVLFEREAELERLESRIDQAVEGQGRVAFVQGPAGIGKTVLLDAGCALAASRDFRVLSARGSDLERQFPLGVVRQLFEDVVLAAAPKARAELLGGLAAYAAPVFGPLDADPGSLDAPDRSEAVLHGLYWLTCNLAERGPLMVAVDDAHWADSPSLLFLNYLSRRIERLPIVLAVSYRAGESGPVAELVRRIAAVMDGAVIELHRLSADATAALVRALLGEDTRLELCGACYSATGGNPLLVRELALALARDELPGGSEAATHVRRLVPDAVARHVLVRLSRLGATSIAVARAIAVLGAGSELRHVAEIAGVGEAEAADGVDALVGADILAPRAGLEFAHPLLREAVCSDFGVAERMRAHARAAKLLALEGAPPERVAAQLLASEPTRSDWAIRALSSAAAEASSRGAADTAARYLRRALHEAPDDPRRPELLLQLGIAESRSAQPSAAEHLAEALRLSSEPRQRARIAQQLAGLYNLLGRFSESATVLEDAIEVVGASDPDLRFGLAAEAAVIACTHRQARQQLAPMMAEFRASLPALADQPAAAPLLAVLAVELAETEGTAERTIEYSERAFADSSLLSREGPLPSIGPGALVLADRPARAEALLDAAISQGRARGSVRSVRGVLTSRAVARLWLGRPAEAEADARLALELSSEEPYDPLDPLKLACLGEALIEQGRLDEAEELVSPAELARHDPDLQLRQPLVDTRARLLLLRGSPDEARAQLDAQLRWQRAWGLRNPGLTSTRQLASLAAYALSDSERAHALATEELEAARAFGSARAVGIGLRTIALVGAAPQIECLRDAVATLEGSEAKLELARTLVELGSALRRAGERREAREPLRRGLDEARASGGMLIADRASSELLASGARPRRQRTTGRDALTPSERRIATMANEGLSNRQIAQTLFLSVKTVEMHLGHAYSKLDVHSRRELASAFREPKKQGPGTGLSP
jgi:DNA-binding CsgD family transcriptional regulator